MVGHGEARRDVRGAREWVPKSLADPVKRNPILA